MKRYLVQLLLFAHPAAFRARFGEEISELYLEMFEGKGFWVVGDLLWSFWLQWMRVVLREPACPAPAQIDGPQYLNLGVESPGVFRLLQSVLLIALAIVCLWVANVVGKM